MRCDAGFLDPGYLEAYGKYHRGVDLNLITGGDTDLGYPVSACVPGVVVDAGVVGSWGGIVVVRADDWVRRMAMDAFERPIASLEVQYAHLNHMVVTAGQTVNAGDCVGSVGKGTFQQYVAHLHLEVRVRHYAAGLPQGGTDAERDFALASNLDPELFFKRLPFSDHPNTLAQKRYYVPTRILGVEHHGQGAAVIHPVGDKLYLEGQDART